MYDSFMTNDNIKYDAFEQEIRVGDWVGYAKVVDNYHRSVKGRVVEIAEYIRIDVDTASGFNHDEFSEDEDGIYTWLDARHTIRTLEYFPGVDSVLDEEVDWQT